MKIDQYSLTEKLQTAIEHSNALYIAPYIDTLLIVKYSNRAFTD